MDASRVNKLVAGTEVSSRGADTGVFMLGGS